jgi:hypothetical protein
MSLGAALLLSLAPAQGRLGGIFLVIDLLVTTINPMHGR